MIAGGLLVGFGAVYGGGCTSGHGVCGLSRLSSRSFAATATFMAMGFAAVLDRPPCDRRLNMGLFVNALAGLCSVSAC